MNSTKPDGFKRFVLNVFGPGSRFYKILNPVKTVVLAFFSWPHWVSDAFEAEERLYWAAFWFVVGILWDAFWLFVAIAIVYLLVSMLI